MTNDIDKFKFYLIGLINGFPPDDLKQMIKDGDVPILLEFDLPPYLSFVKDVIIEHKEEILENLTYDNVIKYSDEFRPDLAGYIRHPKGQAWIERLLKQVRFIIENVELTPNQMRAKFIKRVKEIKEKRDADERLIQELTAQKELDDEITEVTTPAEPKKKEKKINIPNEYGIFDNPNLG